MAVAAWPIADSARAEGVAPANEPLNVVFFNDFQPFSFVAEDGELKGIAIDWWRLWSRTTGTKVKFLPAHWSRLPDILRTGKADAIGAVGKLEVLAGAGYEFSPPLASFDIRLFYRSDLPGGRRVTDFQDLTVGVIEKASCAEWLRGRGFHKIRPYPDFRSMMDGAVRGDVPAVCANKWGGQYALIKRDAQSLFHMSETLFATPVHWAMPGGNRALYDRIADGFARVPRDELAAIEDKWNVDRLSPGETRQATFRLYFGGLVIGGGIVALLLWAVSLRVRMSRRRRDLRDNAARFQALVDNVPGVVYRKVYTPEGSRIVMVSDAVRDVLGLQPSEVYELTAAEGMSRFWHPDDASTMPLNSCQIPGNGVIEGELRYVLDNGVRHVLRGGARWMMVRERVIERKGDTVTTKGILMDVTARKQAESRLGQREHEIRALVDNSPDCILRYDRDFRRVYANPKWVDLFGRPPASFPGETVEEDSPLAVPGPHVAQIQSVFATGKPADYDAKGKTTAGATLDFNVRLVPEFGVDGAVQSVLFVARDITTLKDSQRMLSHLADTVPGAIFTYQIGPDGQASFPFVSASMQDINGLRPDEVRTDASLAMERIHPDDQPRFAAAAEESARNLSPFHIEMRVRHPERGTVWIEVRSIPARQADGSNLWHGIMLDIGARKRDELELHRREQEFRALAENSPDKIIRYDREFRRVYINSASTWDTHGEYVVPLELGQTPFDGSTAEDPGAYIAKLKAAFETGREQEMEVRERRKNGTILTALVRMVPEFGPDGTVETVLVVGRDITALKESQRMLSHLAEAAPGVLHTFLRRPDGSGAIPYASAHLADIYGVQPEEVVDDNAPARKRIHPDDARRLVAAADESARTLSPLHVEYRVRHPEKGELWVEARSMPERQPDGGVLWYGFLHDVTARKRAEAELRRQEEEIRALVDNSPDIIIRYDTSGRRTFVNQAWADVFGQAPEDLVGKTPLDGTTLTDPKGYLAIILDVAARGEMREFEVSTRNRSGKVEDYHARAVPEFGPDGRVASVLMVAHDVTALKETQQRLARWADVSPGVMYSFHRRGDGSIAVPYASRNFEDLYGLRPEDVALDASAARNRVHPDDLARVVAAFDDSARDLTPFHIDYRVIHPTKGEAWVEANMAPSHHPEGGIIWHGFLHDITIRKKAELAMQMDRELFVQGPVVIVKRRNAPGWPVEYVSPNAQAVLGIPATDFLSGAVKYADIVSPEFRSRLDSDAMAALEAGKRHFVHRPYAVDVPHGKTKWLYEFVSVERAPSGDATHFLSYVVDVTEAKRFEEDSRTKSEFLAHMSHELRTPLNSILGYTEMMGMDSFPLTLEGARKYAENINFAGRILLRHIEDILTYAEINAGKRVVAREPVDVRATLAEVTRMLHPQMRERRLQILSTGERHDLPQVAGDVRSVMQVLTNVLSNAIKYSPDHTKIHVGMVVEDGHVVLAIGDEGPGVAPEKLEIISQPFARSSDPTLARAPGTGLGLSIVVALVGMMKGTVTFGNRREGGLEVRIGLPVFRA